MNHDYYQLSYYRYISTHLVDRTDSAGFVIPIQEQDRETMFIPVMIMVSKVRVSRRW